MAPPTASLPLGRRKLFAAGLLLACGRSGRTDPGMTVQTVEGPIAPGRLGVTLMHEHILVDFVGADRASADRYDRAEVARVSLPHLRALRSAGCRTLVECTPAYLGRDPRLLVQLSRRSGLRLITNTGYYGAAGGRYLPAHAHEETAELLAARWIREAKEGLDGTTVRPGFIKIGVDGSPLPDVNRRLARAAALTHRATGLLIQCHCGSGAAALEVVAELQRAGVSPGALVWVHAQSEQNRALHVEAARMGAWVQFDGVAPDSVDRHVALVEAMREAGCLHRVLISHDAGWYHVGEPGGGHYRGYLALFERFRPALERAGFSASEQKMLLVDHPRSALRTHLRLSG